MLLYGCYLFAVVSDHGPHQLVPVVKLVLHLEEGKPEKTEDHWLLGDFYFEGLSKRSFPPSDTAAQPNVFMHLSHAVSHLKIMSSTSVRVAPILFSSRLKD